MQGDARAEAAQPEWKRILPGAAFALMMGAVGLWLARFAFFQNMGLSALPLAILLGLIIGNSGLISNVPALDPGLDFAKAKLLRLGIILFGFKLTFQDIAHVGLPGIAIAVAMVASVLVVAWVLGKYLFKMDDETTLLVGTGAAICGAAAVLAAEPVLKAKSHAVSVAVATVVVFGTLAMFLYPLIGHALGMQPYAYGLYAGSTIHEVAQVVVAGRAFGEEAANYAVIEKMIRVILLAPFLFALSAWLRARTQAATHARTPLVIPWFAVLFMLVGAFNSLHLLDPAWVQGILQFDNWILAAAMAALGVRTHWRSVKQAGAKPLLLATSVFVWLIVGGYAINTLVLLLFV